MSGPSLLELKKEWLPSITYLHDEMSADCTFYNMSISPAFKQARYDREGNMIEPGQRRFRWGASFNIRYGNTTIRLHSDEHDEGLVRFSNKLTLVRDAIRYVVKECRNRVKNPGEYPEEQKRFWLNENIPETPYTGYCFYEITAKGGGKFYVADCTRSIHLWLDYYGPYTDSFMEKTQISNLESKWAWLEGLAKSLENALASVKKLNDRHEAGELHNLLPQDSDIKVIKE